MNKGSKMFPQKTSRDVGIEDCVCDATGSCQEKPSSSLIINQSMALFSTARGTVTGIYNKENEIRVTLMCNNAI